jgi:hypothetical protein
MFKQVYLLYHMKVPAVEKKFPLDILSRFLECISRNTLEGIYQISAWYIHFQHSYLCFVEVVLVIITKDCSL